MTTTTTPTLADPEVIRRAVSVLVEPGAVTEMRLPTDRMTVSGYYSDVDRLVADAVAANRKYGATYITMNPPKPALLARCADRYKEWVKQNTADTEITKRR